MPGIQILGAGNNKSALVNKEGRLKTTCVSIEPEYHINLDHEMAFNLFFEVEPISEATFFYMKNQSDYPLIIENVLIFDSTNYEEISLYRNPTGNPTGGNEVNPINSNFGSNLKASGIFQYGSDINGLTSGTLYGTIPVLEDIPTQFEFKNWLVLPKNASLRLQCLGESTLMFNLTFFYLPGEV
jgi:hypothetical protein